MRITKDPWQQDFLDTKGDKILCTGRQVGKSVTCSEDAGEWAVENKNKVILMIAPVERQSFALFDKTLNYLREEHPGMISRKSGEKPTKKKMVLVNGTIIWCLPAGLDGSGIRFLTVDRLYADEASRIPEEVWSAVTPMLLTTGGDTILLSTPFGDEGMFYDTWSNKDNAFKSFTKFGIDSETVIKERKICETWTIIQRTKALERLEMEKARMSDLQYSQEYMGSFLKNLRQVFPDKLIKKAMNVERIGRIQQFQRYYLGVDVARMGEDESTFEIIDATNKENLIHVENQVTKQTLTTETTKHIIELDKLYDFKQIFIDDGGMGVGVFDQLLTDEQTRRKVIAINSLARPLTRDEKKKRTVIKEELYNNLLMLMESNKIHLLKDEEIFQSLKSVQFKLHEGKVKYFGTYTHIAEGLIRAAWCKNDKKLEPFVVF